MRGKVALSPLLYVLVSEVLPTQIRKCKEIEGFRLPGGGGLQFKISQYADDATNFVKDERSLHNLLKGVHKYEQGSGAKLNTVKSEAMWLGRWRGNGATPYGLKWVTKMRILGVFYSSGLVSIENENWKSKLLTAGEQSVAAPKALQQLESIGVWFSRVSDVNWKLDDSNTKLRKSNSVVFSVDSCY